MEYLHPFVSYLGFDHAGEYLPPFFIYIWSEICSEGLKPNLAGACAFNFLSRSARKLSAAETFRSAFGSRAPERSRATATIRFIRLESPECAARVPRRSGLRNFTRRKQSTIVNETKCMKTVCDNPNLCFVTAHWSLLQQCYGVFR